MAAQWSPADRERALSTLAAGKSVKEAAKAASVSEPTIRRRMKDPEFEAELKERQRVAVGRARRINDGGAPKCARFLVDVGSGAKKATAAQVSASIAVLKFAGMQPPSQIEIAGSLAALSDEQIAAQLAEAAASLGGAMADGLGDG